MSSRRVARSRHYLMCRPAYFDVTYRINPWMYPAKPTDVSLAVLQWEQLYSLYQELGHTVDLVDPVAGLPDMVYAANAATVLDDRVLIANFLHAERAPEAPAYQRWFEERGYQTVRTARRTNEGEGDLLFAGDRILAGTGFRTDPAAHLEAEETLGAPVVGLTLVDPRFYHLDTALAVLDDGEIMYFPGAFSSESQAVLRDLYPEALLATEADAEVFGLNAISDGVHVLLPEAAGRLADELAERGFEPIGVDLSELFKGGGSVKCCTLELRHAAPGAGSDQ
ncbi:dimethylargininase [Streptomyces sp. NPDC093509]|uniref:dimethylargininase n=1 Tax=Streptomyces sp. NPDC093509 TaxID=3154982 RepID=UPI00344B4D0D